MPDETMDDVLELMRVDCDGERSISWYREHIEAALARRDAALLEVAKEMMEKPDSLTPWPTMSAMIQAWSGRIREIVAGEKMAADRENSGLPENLRPSTGRKDSAAVYHRAGET